MRTRAFRAALFALGVLFAGMAAVPLTASVGGEGRDGIFLITGIFDCCEGDVCVSNGCWIVHDCDDAIDCALP